MLLCLNEFYTIIQLKRIRPQKEYGYLIGLLLFYANYAIATELIRPTEYAIIFIFFLFVFIIELFRNTRYPIHNIAFTILGIVYIALPFSLLPFITFNNLTLFNYNFEVLLSVFILIWCHDSGAYIIGMLIGKHRIMPHISPKKSWEGSLGGIIFALTASYLLSENFHSIKLPDFLALALIVVIFGTLGDFVESHLKRFLGIKDSGNALPGHGGFLDRLDSFIFTVPAVFAYIQHISY